MILPNKIIPFKESILAKMVHILDVLVQGNENPRDLYEKTKGYFEDINQYILALEVAMVLEIVKFDEDKREVRYVKTNKM